MHVTIKTLLLAGFLQVLTTAAYAATLNEVVQALERPFQPATSPSKRIDDYHAEFSQEAHIASLDRTQYARGQVKVRFDYNRSKQDPSVQFRWEYAEPNHQELISNGKKLWVFLPENGQVIVSEIKSDATSAENNPMAFLTGLGDLSRNFTAAFAQPSRDDQGNYRIELRPHKPSSLLGHLTIIVSKSAVEGGSSRPIFPIISTTIYDPSGNSTAIEFSGVRVNRGIAVTEFDFTPPKGIEVLEPGQQP